MKTRRFGLSLVLLLFSVILFGCRSSDGPAEFLYREADVKTVRIQLTESFPVGASAVVQGTVSEACAQVDEIRQDYISSTSTFVLTLTTRRPVEEPCIQGVTPFEAIVPLAVERLHAGVYTVVANGVTASFRLEVDNMAPIR